MQFTQARHEFTLGRSFAPITCSLPGVRSVRTILLICLAGCGGPHPAAVHPVRGLLTVDGRPAARAMVAFHPLGQPGPPAALPVASTGPDGTYRLTTYAAGDGAPAGEYAVTVIWPDDSHPRDECDDVAAHDRLGGRYGDPARSPWRATIRPGANDVPLRLCPPPRPDPDRLPPPPAERSPP